jgi:SAM-dependent methyltransferase
MDLRRFVEEQLPRPPARVLEVGCGAGALARALVRSGYEVVAIDPRAPEGEPFRRVSLEDFADPAPFYAVVASRALHHIPDLGDALDKIARVLAPTGRLILDEHACDRLDQPTARWYMEHRAACGRHAPRSLEDCLAAWEGDHAGLHGYAAMRAEFDARFTERYFAWGPYLYGELRGAVDETDEQALIDAGRIQAMGFRYVGVRRAAH